MDNSEFKSNKIWLAVAQKEYDDKKKTYDNLLHKCEILITFVSVIISISVLNSNQMGLFKNLLDNNFPIAYKIYIWIIIAICLLMYFYLLQFFFNALKVTKSEKVAEIDFSQLEDYSDISEISFENEEYLYKHIIYCINDLTSIINEKNKYFNKCLYNLFYFCSLVLIFKFLCCFI